MMITHSELPSLDAINSRFEYKDGLLVWIKNAGPRKPGMIAGTKNGSGYLCVRIGGNGYLVHRIIYKMLTGIDPGQLYIDHINGVKTDNRIQNLRIASSAENNANKRGAYTNNVSGLRGVSYVKESGKYRARVRVSGKQINLGTYQSPACAFSAAEAYRQKVFGAFAGVPS